MGYLCINAHALVNTTLEAAFDTLDTDKDGKLSYKEFMNAINTLNLYHSRAFYMQFK